jgi:hypothetical protein
MPSGQSYTRRPSKPATQHIVILYCSLLGHLRCQFLVWLPFLAYAALYPDAGQLTLRRKAPAECPRPAKRISIPRTLAISAVPVLQIAPRAVAPVVLSQPSSPQRTTRATKRISISPTIGTSAVPVLGMVPHSEFLAHALHADTERRQQRIDF